MPKIKHTGAASLTCEGNGVSLHLFPADPKKASSKENTYALVSAPEKQQKGDIISWPGEYDYDGTSIRAIGQGEDDQVSYVVTSEGVRCGFISSPLQEWHEHQIELLGDLDIMVVPTDDAKKVQSLVDEVDPRVVIVLKTGDEKTAAEIVAACGGKDVETVKDVKFKKSGLPSETREVYVFG